MQPEMRLSRDRSAVEAVTTGEATVRDDRAGIPDSRTCATMGRDEGLRSLAQRARGDLFAEHAAIAFPSHRRRHRVAHLLRLHLDPSGPQSSRVTASRATGAGRRA